MGAHVDFLFLLPNRSVYITFSDFESVQGLPALRYKVPAEILANTSDNAGFCVPKGNCLGSGVLNVSVCKNGKNSERGHGQEGLDAGLVFFNKECCQPNRKSDFDLSRITFCQKQNHRHRE